MAILFVVPFFFSLYYVLKRRPDLAFLNVYLPCVFVVPLYYIYRIPHLPPASVADWALLPIGVSLLIQIRPPTHFKRMDLWILLYLISFGASEILRDKPLESGISFFENMSLQMLLAYVVGRRLIEPDLRLKVIKRIVALFLCLTPAILYEYRMGQNVWLNGGASVFGVRSGSFGVSRNGHIRVQACFGHPILAGILFCLVFLLNAALVDIYKQDRNRLGTLFANIERYHVPEIVLVLFLLSTRSRGPLIAAFVGYCILQIPRFRNLKVGAFVVLLLLGIAGGLIFNYFDKYTNATDNGSLSEQQTSAIYRRQLLVNYKPILEEGGWLGWGVLSHPQVAGQSSIDNSYLLIQLAQGKLGLYLFLLIAAESIISCIRCAFVFRARESRFFAFTLLGAMIGLFASLYTVYLGQQVVQACFLLGGWSQSLQDTGRVYPAAGLSDKFRFRRVFA